MPIARPKQLSICIPRSAALGTLAGIHFVQGASPDEIGKAIVDWMGRWADGGHAGARCQEQATGLFKTIGKRARKSPLARPAPTIDPDV
jgi:hypothetical protein